MEIQRAYIVVFFLTDLAFKIPMHPPLLWSPVMRLKVSSFNIYIYLWKVRFELYRKVPYSFTLLNIVLN